MWKGAILTFPLKPRVPKLYPAYKEEQIDTRRVRFREVEDEIRQGVNFVLAATNRHLWVVSDTPDKFKEIPISYSWIQ